jgi:hypothetical protein
MNLVFAAGGAAVAVFGAVAGVVLDVVPGGLAGVALGGVAVVVPVACDRADNVAASIAAEQRKAQAVRLVMRAMIRQARMNRADFFRNRVGDY